MFLFIPVLPLYSQTDAAISYAEGNGFQLVRNGLSTVYDISADDVIGLPVLIGDTILTDENSFIEIQLNNGNGGVVKMAENTTFTVSSLDAGGGGVFKVLFGRIRVKVAALAGGSRLWVTGYDTVAGVRGTDFGYDLFYDPESEDGEHQTSVYCFEGAVDVVQYDKKTGSKTDLMSIDPFILEAGKMVKTKSSSPGVKMRSKNIESEIVKYWNAYPIVSFSQNGVTEDETLEVSDNLNLQASLDSVKGTYETGGKITFALGVGMMTIGGLLKAFLPDNTTTDGISTGLLVIGGVSAAAGGGMMLYSVSLP